jgi:signal peptidase II
MTATVLSGGVLVLDLLTKSWALSALAGGRRLELLGGWVPLTLAFNQGAAFGLRIGSDPRLVFIPVTILAIGFLLLVLLRAERADWLRIVAASLVLGGALGNLYDRVRWDRGVVDFIGPLDLGFMLWPVFNVADMGITVGAILLAISFWREDMARADAGAMERSSRSSPSPAPEEEAGASRGREGSEPSTGA